LQMPCDLFHGGKKGEGFHRKGGSPQRVGVSMPKTLLLL
jgi:hypothetical protein